MEINQLLKIGVELIKGRPYSNPILEATLILSKLLKVDRVYIYSHGIKEVPKDIEDLYMELIKKRAGGYPLQYIIGKTEFMGLEFHIEEGVLIPREDTETLVEYILDNISKEETVNVLDLGTGSGAIALSIAYYRRNACVHGVDKYQIPLKVADINRRKFKLNNVKLFKGDMFEGVRSLKHSYHIIVSNPPYIPKEDILDLQEEVKDFEPMRALDGGWDGLNYYRKIIPESIGFLRANGLLALEIGYNQGESVKKIMLDQGFKKLEIIKDLENRNRVISGRI